MGVDCIHTVCINWEAGTGEWESSLEEGGRRRGHGGGEGREGKRDILTNQRERE